MGIFLGILGYIRVGYSCGLNGWVGVFGVGCVGVVGSVCGGFFGGIGYLGVIILDGYFVVYCDFESWEGCFK